MAQPLIIRMHDGDNVAIVANDGGLPAGTVLPGGPTLREKVPQAHKVALVDLPAGMPVRRYGVIIGHALRDIAAGSWVHERLLKMPAARGLEGLPMATVKPPPLPPLTAPVPAARAPTPSSSRRSSASTICVTLSPMARPAACQIGAPPASFRRSKSS